MLDESQRYQEYMEQQEASWEKQCIRCGACCGLFDGDPCQQLVHMRGAEYVCRVYDHRYGMQQTRSGRMFRCVPIRTILHKSWSGDYQCRYKKGISSGHMNVSI